MIACIAYVNTHCVWLYGEIIINISLVMIYFLVIFFPQKDFFLKLLFCNNKLTTSYEQK